LLQRIDQVHRRVKPHTLCVMRQTGDGRPPVPLSMWLLKTLAWASEPDGPLPLAFVGSRGGRCC
jgi:hypothetical protein